MKPKYKHTCNKCVFMGAIEIEGRHEDVYCCDETVLMRRSDEDSDYFSWNYPFLLRANPELTVHDDKTNLTFVEVRFVLAKYFFEKKMAGG